MPSDILTRGAASGVIDPRSGSSVRELRAPPSSSPGHPPHRFAPPSAPDPAGRVQGRCAQPPLGIAAIPGGATGAHHPSTAAGPNRASRISATLGSHIRASVVPPNNVPRSVVPPASKAGVEPTSGPANATRAPSPAPAPAALPRIGSLPRSPTSARSRRFSTSRARASRSPGDPGTHSVVSPARRSASTPTRVSNGAPATRTRPPRRV